MLDFKRDTKKTHKVSSFGRPHGAETQGEEHGGRGGAVARGRPQKPRIAAPATAPTHPEGAACRTWDRFGKKNCICCHTSPSTTPIRSRSCRTGPAHSASSGPPGRFCFLSYPCTNPHRLLSCFRRICNLGFCSRPGPHTPTPLLWEAGSRWRKSHSEYCRRFPSNRGLILLSCSARCVGKQDFNLRSYKISPKTIC